ncbi:MAG: hypothetical protein ACK559_18935, partial [bacterium]
YYGYKSPSLFSFKVTTTNTNVYKYFATFFVAFINIVVSSIKVKLQPIRNKNFHVSKISPKQ